MKHAGTSFLASRRPLRRAYVRNWPGAAVLRKMADRRRQRASQDTEDEESGASGSDSGGSPARGGGGCSGSTGGGGSGSLPSQRGGRAGALHLRRVESGGAKSAEESECVSARGRRPRRPAGRGRGVGDAGRRRVGGRCRGPWWWWERRAAPPGRAASGAPREEAGPGAPGGECGAAAEPPRMLYSEAGLEAKSPRLPPSDAPGPRGAVARRLPLWPFSC